MMSNQFIRQNFQGHKKYRPQRASAGNQQIRISRPFSQGSDTDQNSKTCTGFVFVTSFNYTKHLEVVIVKLTTEAIHYCDILLILKFNLVLNSPK